MTRWPRWASTSRPGSARRDLSGGERQSVAIARAVYFGARGRSRRAPPRHSVSSRRASSFATSCARSNEASPSFSSRTTPPRVPGRGPLRDPPARAGVRILPEGRARDRSARPDDGGGAELENLAHELQREAGDDAELRKAAAVLEQEVEAVAGGSRSDAASGRRHGRRGVNARGLKWTPDGPYDLVTMGRVGRPVSEQSGVPLAEVRVRESSRWEPDERRRRRRPLRSPGGAITKVGEDGFGDYVRSACAGSGSMTGSWGPTPPACTRRSCSASCPLRSRPRSCSIGSRRSGHAARAR